MGSHSEEGELGEEGGAAGLGGRRQVCHVEAKVHLLPVQVYVCMKALHTCTDAWSPQHCMGKTQQLACKPFPDTNPMLPMLLLCDTNITTHCLSKSHHSTI